MGEFMTREEILNDITSLLRQNRSKLQNVSAGTAIKEFGLDSVRFTSFLMGLEEFFKVLVPDQECEKWGTVDDIINYIEEYHKDSAGLNPIDIGAQNPDIEDRET
jgi:acyl carrier protein